MAFVLSLSREKIRRVFAVSFCLSFLLPVLVFFLILSCYVYPILDPEQLATLAPIFNTALIILGIVPALGFVLVHRWIVSFEEAADEIQAKLEQMPGNRELSADPVAGGRKNEGNEVQFLVDSFNIIFQSALASVVEKEHLQELLSSIIALSADVASELDFDRLFHLVVSKVTEVMDAERTSLYIIDWEKRELWTRAAEGLESFRVPLGKGISGRVAETGETINVADAWQWPDFDRSYDLKNEFRTRSVLCLPLTNRDGVRVGVLQIINKKGGDRFGKEDEIFLRGLKSQVGVALENSLLHDELLVSFNSAIATLSAVVDARHPFTAGHSERVKEYSVLIAKEMGLTEEEQEVLRVAALLHDIGKIGIPDQVLLKNGVFTPEERAEMEDHALHTRQILENFHFPRMLQRVPEVAGLHHERINGQGYPYGLTGDHLPLGSKIMAVADVFDALVSKRDYPKYTTDGTPLDCDRVPLDKALRILEEGIGTQFEAEVVAAFKSCLPEIERVAQGERPA